MNEVSPKETTTQLFLQVFCKLDSTEQEQIYGALLGAIKETYKRNRIKGAELLYRASMATHLEGVHDLMHDLMSKHPPEPRKRKKKDTP